MDNKLEYIPGDLVMVKESALQFAKDKIFKSNIFIEWWLS